MLFKYTKASKKHSFVPVAPGSGVYACANFDYRLASSALFVVS